MNTYNYCVLDVFTNERFKGNPLAVVFADSELQLTTYENISREFGYSETSFIYYSTQEKALKVRSFTPTGFEVNGAGHNLLGAACAAILRGIKIFHEQDGRPFVIMKDEVIRLSVEDTSDGLLIGMQQRHAVIVTAADSKIIAEALSLDPDEILDDNLVPAVVKTEVAHLMVPVKSPEVLNKTISNKSMLIKIADKYNFEGVYCFAFSSNERKYFAQTRFFNPGIGIDEDPATGSAAGPLAGYLFQKGYIQRDTIYQLLQGVKVNHRSVIRFEVTNEGIWISGYSVIVMEGTIYE